MRNQITFEYCDDGDYVVHWSEVGDEIVVHTAWLIPGTEMEEG